MNVFKTWQGTLYKYNNHIAQFLVGDEEYRTVLCEGTKEEIKQVLDILLDIPFKSFIEELKKIDIDPNFTPAEIMQFSNYEHGVIRLPEILDFPPYELGFDDIGKQLYKSRSVAACKKYGENHAKLAACLDLVTVERHGASVVRNTALGRYLTGVPIEDKKAIFRRLFLRDRLIQFIIQKALLDKVRYSEVVKCLSLTTANRRKTNVKRVVEEVLKNTDYEYVLDNIIW